MINGFSGVALPHALNTAQRIVGEKHLKCNLKLQGTNSVLEGIAFFQEKLNSKKVRAAYKLNVNSFRGNESLQLMIESIEGA